MCPIQILGDAATWACPSGACVRHSLGIFAQIMQGSQSPAHRETVGGLLRRLKSESGNRILEPHVPHHTPLSCNAFFRGLHRKSDNSMTTTKHQESRS